MADVHIRVDSRLRIPRSDLPDAVRDRLRAEHTYENPALARMARMARRNRKLAWRLRGMPSHVQTWEEDADHFTLPRGAMAKLRRALTEAGLSWRLEDARTRGTGPLYPDPPRHRPAPLEPDGGALRWYQAEGVEAAMAVQNCLLRAPTGSGKTTTAIAVAVAAGVPTLVVVWSSGLFGQWEERLQRELGLRSDEIGRVRGSDRVIRPITIAMQQSLWRVTDPVFYEKWGMVIVDEVQRTAARTVREVVDRFPARYRIGISADESRADGMEFLTYDLFGSVVHEVTQDELVAEGAVLDVECRVVPTDLRADWYVQQREGVGAPDFNRLLGELGQDEARNEIILGLVTEEVAAGQQVLVLAHRVEHCQRLDALFASRGYSSEVMLGGEEWRDRFEAARAGLANGRVQVATGTIQAVGTGIDIPVLGRGVLATPVGSNRQLYGQIRGRLSRIGKADAVLYVLWDRHVQGKSVLKNMLRWNRAVVVRSSGAWIDGHEYLRRLDDG